MKANTNYIKATKQIRKNYIFKVHQHINFK